MFTGFFRGRKDDEQFYKTKACKKLQNLFTIFYRLYSCVGFDAP